MEKDPTRFSINFGGGVETKPGLGSPQVEEVPMKRNPLHAPDHGTIAQLDDSAAIETRGVNGVK